MGDEARVGGRAHCPERMRPHYRRRVGGNRFAQDNVVRFHSVKSQVDRLDGKLGGTVHCSSDEGWVVGVIALVLTGWLSTRGNVVMLASAVVVGGLAVAQFVFSRELGQKSSLKAMT